MKDEVKPPSAFLAGPKTSLFWLSVPFLFEQWNNFIKTFPVLDATGVINILTTFKGFPKGSPPGGRVKVVKTFGLKVVSHSLGGLH